MKRRGILIQRFCQPDSSSPNIPDLYRPLPQLPESVSQRTAISTCLPIARLCLFSLLTAVSVHAFAVDSDLLDLAQVTAPKVSIRRPDGSKAKVVIGGTGMSGPIFLDDRSFRDFAFQKWHARIHEMEGTAIAQVGYYNRVLILIVRALSDLAGGQSGVNQEERNSQFAASNAAEVTAKILERIESAQ
jgi:nucleoside phosphorylase